MKKNITRQNLKRKGMAWLLGREAKRLYRAPMDSVIKSAGTGAFVVRRNDYNGLAFESSPDIHWGATLSGGYAVGYADKSVLDTFLKDIKVFNRALPLSPMSQAVLDSANITPLRQNPYLNLRGGGTLIGFVDTGIDYAKPAFRWEDGTTKIEYIWDQSLSGESLAPFGYGVEFTRGQINEALNSSDPYGAVSHQDLNGHGTFLASVAASHENGQYTGVAPDAGLVVVKLKGASAYCRGSYMVPPQSAHVYETVDLMYGIEYVIGKAAELSRPVAICIGLGTNHDGHDGYGVLEEYLTRMSGTAGVAICCAAGNEGAGLYGYLIKLKYISTKMVKNGYLHSFNHDVRNFCLVHASHN